LIRGEIMSVEGGVAEIGQYQIITLNRGSRDGLQVGHVLASYHKGALVSANGHGSAEILDTGWLKGVDIKPVPVVPDPPGTPMDQQKAGAALAGSSAIKLPDERNGIVFVFRVFEKMSYAMVMRASKPIYVGDVVRTP
jgi:hypothetical protein